MKMAPTKEEEAKLTNYAGDINELVYAERFVKVLLGIPFAFPKIEAMLFRETFEDEVVHLKNSFSMLEVTKYKYNHKVKSLFSLYVYLLGGLQGAKIK